MEFEIYGYEEAVKKLNKRIKVRTLRAWVAEARTVAKKRGRIFKLIRGRYFTDRLLAEVLDLVGCPEYFRDSK
jgi:hypothetical protein